jgi:acyl transferase domain-containing protein
MPIIYMFPGQGAQYVGMGRDLYEREPEYRSVIDRCAEVVAGEFGLDLKQALYPEPGEAPKTIQAVELINQTRVTQLALFAVELGLARMWRSKGVRPAAMIGHSLGEYTAACLAGVMSEEQTIRLVARRSALMQSARPGAMLAVALSEGQLRERLHEARSRLDVAAINGPQQCVLSGEEEEIGEFERRLNVAGIAGKRLKTSHAFHSRMMEDVVCEFEKEVGRVELKPPSIRYISNVSGKWILAEEAQAPGYWGRQMREPVRYWEGLESIGREFKERVLLEVGPGETLARLGRQLAGEGRQAVVATLGSETGDGARAVIEAAGKLWANGVEIDWGKWRKGKQRRVDLPGYAFEEKRYWIDAVGERTGRRALRRKEDVGEWFYAPAWKETAPVMNGGEEKECRRWLILEDDYGIGARIASNLERRGGIVTKVKRATHYERRGEREYQIRIGEAEDYKALLKDLEGNGELPERIVHLFSMDRVETRTAPGGPGWETRIEEAAETGFYSLVYLAQAIRQRKEAEQVKVVVVSNKVTEVMGEEEIRAEKAMLLGPVNVMKQEYPELRSRYIDVIIPSPGSWQEDRLIGQLIVDLKAESADPVVAYRGNRRWARTYEPVRIPPAEVGTGLRPAGVYLITGGLGGVGMILAEYLARSVKARLALVGREGLPERSEWDRLMEEAEVNQEMKRKIRKIREMEEAGAEIEVMRADVSKEEEMKEVVRRIRRRFGAINGVIHAAGLTGAQYTSAIQDLTPAVSSLMFRPKVHGLFVLEKALQDVDLDFCLLLSSLSSVLGGLGFAAYSSSNIFMDTFVYERNRVSPIPWISVNWDGWQLREKDYSQSAGPGSAQAELAIKPQEGVEAFQRIISTKMAGQIIVSTGDLQSRIRKWIDLESLDGESQQNRTIPLSGHSRPELQTGYVAPRNDLERSIAAIWQTLLGLERIGIHDNFFELGGHSLLVIQYLSRLRKAFQVDVPIHMLFEKSTIAEHGEVIEEALIEEIEALTEEEAATWRRRGN